MISDCISEQASETESDGWWRDRKKMRDSYQWPSTVIMNECLHQHIHKDTHTGHSPLEASGCDIYIYYCRNISTQRAVPWAVSQRGDLLDGVTAGGQDRTYTYTPTETAGSTAPLYPAWLFSFLPFLLSLIFFSFLTSTELSAPSFGLQSDSISQPVTEMKRWKNLQ